MTQHPKKEGEFTDKVTISVAAVDGMQAAAATDRIEALVEKYKIAGKDIDALFDAMISIYIRGRMVYGDRSPAICNLADCCEPPESESE